MPKLKSKPNRQHRHQQHGAVLIVFGLSIAVLIGFLALVIDLGRTYVIRTELQNAADAAALAGARELNQTRAGVTSAVNFAVAMAAQNNFKFTSPVVIAATNVDATNNIWVGSCPDDVSCTMVRANSITTDALAADKSFLKVEIPSGGLATFFANLLGVASNSTFGSAVAGHFFTDITPMGVCAVDPTRKGDTRDITVSPGVVVKELVEYGFRRGIAYDLMQLGPVGSSSTPYLLNPVDVFGGGNCKNSNGSASTAVPFVCKGSSTVAVKVPGSVYGSTGNQSGLDKALNSRFDDYQGNACSSTTAPPDINIREYIPGGGGQFADPRDWTEVGGTLPTQQSIQIVNQKPLTNPTAAEYGTLWSYSRAIKAVGNQPFATAATDSNANFTLSDWPALYAGLTADQTDLNNYPLTPSVGAVPSPYNTSSSISSGKYFRAPNVARPGNRDRRVLQIAIVNCPASINSNNNCSSDIRILAVGRFFMPKKTDIPTTLIGEFDGLVDPVPPTDTRLYK